MFSTPISLEKKNQKNVKNTIFGLARVALHERCLPSALSLILRTKANDGRREMILRKITFCPLHAQTQKCSEYIGFLQ